MQARVRLSLGLAGILAVFLSVPASAFVRSPVALLPDGDTRPEIHSAELRSPQPHNQLLEADLVVDAIDNDGIARFEYRWNSATYGAVHSVVGSPLQVSYASIRPNTRYALELRAIDIHNNPSAWYPVWSGLTPGPPHVIVAGDSIASGYTRRWFLGDATCRDSDLSYGRTVVSELSATLPDQWAVRYANIAWASAGVDDMSSGGDDSCGGTHSSQLDQIDVLAADDSWNIVVVTAGINSTNWSDVIVDLTRDTAFRRVFGQKHQCSCVLDRLLRHHGCRACAEVVPDRQRVRRRPRPSNGRAAHRNSRRPRWRHHLGRHRWRHCDTDLGGLAASERRGPRNHRLDDRYSNHRPMICRPVPQS